MEKLVEKQSNGLEVKSGEAEACHQGKPRLVGSGGDFGSNLQGSPGDGICHTSALSQLGCFHS